MRWVSLCSEVYAGLYWICGYLETLCVSFEFRSTQPTEDPKLTLMGFT